MSERFRMRGLHARDTEALWQLDQALVEDGRGMVMGPEDLSQKIGRAHV